MIQVTINVVTCALLVGAYFGIQSLTKDKDDKRVPIAAVLTLLDPSVHDTSMHE